MKKLSILLAVSVLGAAALLTAAEPARKAPPLSFNLPGEGHKTLADYRGKVVALEFIFTTCPHCQAASHLMSKLQQEYGARGLQVIDVAVNQNADLLVENFAKDYQVNFPVGWTTSEQMTTFMGFTPGRFVVPQLVMIDRAGNMHYQTPATENDQWDKLMKEDAIRQHLEELLGSGGNSASRRHPGHAQAASSGKSGS